MAEKTIKTNFDDYVWFTPKPKVPQAAITIPNPDALNLNKYALQALPPKFAIGVAPDGATLCLRENPETGYSPVKSGAIKDKELVAFLMEAGVELPARYVLKKVNDFWVAELAQTAPKKINLNKPPRRIGKQAKRAIEEELKSK